MSMPADAAAHAESRSPAVRPCTAIWRIESQSLTTNPSKFHSSRRLSRIRNELAEAGTPFTEPLMTLFAEDHTMDRSLEATKEILWEKHFSDFGRGVSMFRTEEATRLVVKGIPDR